MIRFCFALFFSFIMLMSCVSSNKEQTKQQENHSDADSLPTSDSLLWTNDTIQIFRIDSIDFFASKDQSSDIQHDTIPYISDLEAARKALKGRVWFGGWNSDLNKVDTTLSGSHIAKIIFDNKTVQEFGTSPQSWEAGFYLYFPSENILVLEGGHTSDIGADLKTGIIDSEIVGNPSYIRYSPSKDYRLNGWFPGQECSDYFLQKKTSQGYELLSRIPIHLGGIDFLFCTLVDIFWKNEQELYFRNTFFSEDDRQGFFKLIILN